jgi:hypothetical protein
MRRTAFGQRAVEVQRSEALEKRSRRMAKEAHASGWEGVDDE